VPDNHNNQLNKIERIFSLFTKVRAGEGRSIVLFSMYAMILMMSYYVFKTMRETLILTEFSAEVRSYATAAIALLLFFVVPLYSVLFRQGDKEQLIRWVTLFFVSNVLIFYMMGRAGMEFSFVYYIWVGIFGVMMITQFWAFATDHFNIKTGQRLFPVIMAGQALGAVAGAQIFSYLLPLIGAYNLLLLAGLLLAGTTLLTSRSGQSVPAESAAVYEEITEDDSKQLAHVMGGLALVWRNRYLMLIAAVVVLLNWINSTGEFIFAEWVTRLAEAADVEKSVAIARFYGIYFTAITSLGFLLQLFLVSRIYRWIGVSGALLILPVIAMIGYGMIVFIPVFSLIWLVKVIENSTEYSINNTTRHALYLPLTQREKYEGKTAIDTFFWRVGDLIQAGAIYAGLNWFGFEITHFALINMLLASVWIWLVVLIGRQYKYLARTNIDNVPPILQRPIPEILAPAGSSLIHELDHDHFHDADPGDHLTLSACAEGCDDLPVWLRFEAITRRFTGMVPDDVEEITTLQVTATDFDGLCVTTRLIIRHR
jgi:AAA family ATP:ADP antiporter